MIDYEKLREAEKLAEKVNKRVKIGSMTLWHENNSYCLFNSVDLLIEHLEDLLTSHAKYAVGDTVWYYDVLDDEICEVKIAKIKVNHETIYYQDDYSNLWSDSELYSTRESLIHAQIKHWQDKLNDHIADAGKMVCEHESDGLVYTSCPPQNKCKKCGEFYR